MQAMSSKAAARELMLRSGVPVLPGYQGERQELPWLLEQAQQIGYPVLHQAGRRRRRQGHARGGRGGEFCREPCGLSARSAGQFR